MGRLDEPHSVVGEARTIERDLFVMLPPMRCRYVRDKVLAIGDTCVEKANQYSLLLNLDLGEYSIDAIGDPLMPGHLLGDCRSTMA
jgi:hypothetical protein